MYICTSKYICNVTVKDIDVTFVKTFIAHKNLLSWTWTFFLKVRILVVKSFCLLYFCGNNKMSVLIYCHYSLWFQSDINVSISICHLYRCISFVGLLKRLHRLVTHLLLFIRFFFCVVCADIDMKVVEWTHELIFQSSCDYFHATQRFCVVIVLVSKVCNLS